MRRAFPSLPLLVAFALLDGCGGGDADSSSGAGAGGPAGHAGSAAGKGGATSAAGAAGSGGDAGASAGAASTTGNSGAAGAGGTAPCGGSWATIPGVPKDWVPFSTPDCRCTFYVPPPGGAAAGVEWEGCPSDGLQGVSCQKMKSAAGGEEFGTYGTQWSAQPPRLQVLRGYPAGPDPTRLELVFADLAGTPPWAVAGPYRASCRPIPYAPFDGRFAIGTLDQEKQTHGVVAGVQGSGIEIARSGLPSGDVTSGWGASASYVYRAVPGKISASAWTDDDGDAVYQAAMDPDALPGAVHYLKGGDAFLKVVSSGYTGFVSWNKSAGVRLLLRTLHDNTRGFMHLGSDGVDLAFTYGEAAGKAYEFSRRTLFTAPYTTDPVTLKATAKALTAVPRISSPSRWGVGCGYAAAGAADDVDGVSVIVVRLSDGFWWRKWPKDPQTFGGIQALGVTCDEIILTAGKLAIPTRVRLDSLGEPSPPIPPDIQQPPF